MIRLARHFMLVMAAAACLTAPAAAQRAPSDSAVEATTRALATELRCPVCQGLSLQDSPSELAQEMRGVIRDQVRAGRSPEQIKAYFIDKYGEWILLEPPAKGFNLLVYALPALAVLVGLFIVWRAVRKWTTPGAASSAELVVDGQFDGESPTSESPTSHRRLAD